jgi:hypothetical protein
LKFNILENGSPLSSPNTTKTAEDLEAEEAVRQPSTDNVVNSPKKNRKFKETVYVPVSSEEAFDEQTGKKKRHFKH